MDHKTLPGSKLCFALTGQTLTAYGNAAALRSLARWLDWLADSDPKDHHEFHSTLALQENRVLLDDSLPRTVWFLTEPIIAKALGESASQADAEPGTAPASFEVTYMHVAESELQIMEKFQTSGNLPDDWAR